MADISLNFVTTPAQDVKLAAALSEVNKAREARGLTPFPSIESWLKNEVLDAVVNWVKILEDRENKSVRHAFMNATDSQKDQIKSILGL